MISLPKLRAAIGREPALAPYTDFMIRRWTHYDRVRQQIGSLIDFADSHLFYGFHPGEHHGVPGTWFREWAPAAKGIHLIGDFNGWNRRSHALSRDDAGNWQVFLPHRQGVPCIHHGTRVKLAVDTGHGLQDRIPSHIRRVTQDTRTLDFAGVYGHPEDFSWLNQRPARPDGLRIYEAHVGMSSERKGIATFAEFSRDVLPRIAKLGYNAIQLMACMQHPYYGSFGYQVSNFFAVSHYFGTPEDLKSLVDQAHGLGLLVFLDLVHSHSVSNVHEGLSQFDGTTYQYFHDGERGNHPAWDSKCFNYGKPEVLRFLLSNVRYWLEEYLMDGFRFDGVTSMIYRDHGLGRQFTSYDDYFQLDNLDEDAMVYLQLANELIHQQAPSAITIAEEVSGTPGLARPLDEAGLGFDYRLAMGIPDHWIKLLKEQRDEDWHLGDLVHVLTNRRQSEMHVAYCESHDQALVGDKTIAFRLMDAEMYVDMEIGRRNITIERGVALHKLIRLITYGMGGDAWLNFMGNEFGHPDWVDFPREGNQFSYHHARRQWSLADSPFLRYSQLQAFDMAMHALDDRFRLLGDPEVTTIAVDEELKTIQFQRANLVFLFNFHPWRSHSQLEIGVPCRSDYRVVLNSDDGCFGGQCRVEQDMVYQSMDLPTAHSANSIHVYLPSRTCQVLTERTPSSRLQVS